MEKIGEINGSKGWLNFYAIIVLGALYRFVYIRAWGMDEPSWVTGAGVIVLLAMIFLLMVMHDVIHWVMATTMLGKAKACIKIRIFASECNVDGYFRRNQYIMYALAPGVVFGLIGLIVYYAVSQSDIRFIGAVMFVGGVSLGTADYWFVSKAIKYPNDSYVRDFGIRMEIFRSEAAG